MEEGSGKEKKQKKPGKDDEDEEEDMLDEDDVPQGMEGRRILFEEGRDAILSEVPDDAKARFGQIYFTTWGAQVLPVLVMNPYSVPPGTARKLWLDMFDNLKKSGRLSNMTNLVYWYGSSQDKDNCYSIWTTKMLTTYESGVKKKLDQIPPALQKKIDSGKKLVGGEAQFIAALKEMNDDLTKEPHQRRGYLPKDFVEVWELSSDDEGDAVSEEKPIASKKRQGGKAKKESKTKKPTSQKRKSDAATIDGSSDEPRKKPKTGKKVKQDQSAVSMPPKAEKVAVGQSEARTGNEPKRDQSTVGTTEHSSPPKSDEMVVGQSGPADAATKERNGDPALQHDVPVHSNLVDAAVKKELDEYEYNLAMGFLDQDSDIDSESDEDFGIPSESAAAVTLKKHQANRDGMEKSKKKELSAKSKTAKTRKKHSTEPDKGREEQKNFARSEEEFHPVFIRWQQALVAQDRDAMMTQMQDVRRRVERIHLSLMSTINKLLIATKKILSEDQKDAFKLLRSALKSQYDKKKDGCPAGFKPKRKYAPIDLDDAMEVSARDGSHGPLLSTAEGSKQLDSSASLASEGLAKRAQPPPPLMQRSGSLEKVSEKKEESTDGMVHPKDVKIERKKFSLGNLMRSNSDLHRTSAKATDKASSAIQISQKQVATLPDWVTGKVSLEVPTDDRRSFGFEFLRQAAPFIQGKGIDHHSIACTLEACIESWSAGDINKYWKKIDDIVVALSGDKRLGTLSAMISKGDFKQPGDVVSLSDAQIYDSFLGKPFLF